MQIPKTVKEALELDAQNRDSFWQDAIKKEMGAMFEKEVFEFKGKGYKPSSKFQHARLQIVFDLKQDLTRKARLVV